MRERHVGSMLTVPEPRVVTVYCPVRILAAGEALEDLCELVRREYGVICHYCQ